MTALANALALRHLKVLLKLKSLQGRGTESLVGFKGETLNILCSLSADFVRTFLLMLLTKEFELRTMFTP